MFTMSALIDAIALDSVDDEWRAKLNELLAQLKEETDAEVRVELSAQVMQAVRTLANRGAVAKSDVVATAKPDVLSGETVGEVLASARKYAIQQFAGKTVVNKSDQSSIIIAKSGIEHALSRRAGIVNAMVVTDLENMLRGAQWLRTTPDKSGRKEIKAAHFYGCKVEIGGRIVEIGIVVREHEDGRRYYDHFELKTKSPAKTGDSGAVLDGTFETTHSATMEELGHRPKTRNGRILAQSSTSVNGVLDSVSPLARVKLLGDLTRAVTDLETAANAIAKISASAKVQALLAQLTGDKPKTLEVDINNPGQVRMAIQAYMSDLSHIPPALQDLEAMALARLGEMAEVEIRAPVLTDALASAAFREISSRAIKVDIDVDKISQGQAELDAAYALAASARRKELSGLNSKMGALNTEYAMKGKAMMREANEFFKAGNMEAGEAKFAEFKAYEADFKAAFKELQKQFNAIKKTKVEVTAESTQEAGERVISAIVSRSPITAEQAADWAKSQQVDSPTLNKLKRLGYHPDQMRSDMADFYRITGGRIPAIEITSTRNRAHASGIESAKGRKVVAVGSRFDRGVLFHELGHHMEADPIAKAAANGFLVKRRTSSKLHSLRKLAHRGYDIGEMAYEDHFIDPYVGKYYRDGITEVFSMGMQQLADPQSAAAFYAKDPEMYALITGFLAEPPTPAAKALAETSTKVTETKRSEEQEIAAQYEAALAKLAANVSLVKSDWWERDPVRAKWYVEQRARKNAKLTYIGSYSGDTLHVVEGSFKNSLNRKYEKGYMVIRVTGQQDFESIELHDGLDGAKAAIALAVNTGESLYRINSRYFGRYPMAPYKDRREPIINAANMEN